VFFFCCELILFSLSSCHVDGGGDGGGGFKIDYIFLFQRRTFQNKIKETQKLKNILKTEKKKRRNVVKASPWMF